MKRITLIFTIFMALFSFAQNENTKDFSDFEKKLISGNINYNYIKNDSARTDSADTNSDSTEFTKSDDKTFNIEKEPDTAEISITPYLEARQALLNAIKKKKQKSRPSANFCTRGHENVYDTSPRNAGKGKHLYRA